jgi:hypothetical protein
MADFPKGLIFKKPHDNAPSFVKGTLSIKVNEFIEWIKLNNTNGWCNIDLKESKDGKYYSQLNTYQKQEPRANYERASDETKNSYEEADKDENGNDDLPF